MIWHFEVQKSMFSKEIKKKRRGKNRKNVCLLGGSLSRPEPLAMKRVKNISKLLGLFWGSTARICRRVWHSLGERSFISHAKTITIWDTSWTFKCYCYKAGSKIMINPSYDTIKKKEFCSLFLVAVRVRLFVVGCIARLRHSEAHKTLFISTCSYHKKTSTRN